LVQGDVIAAQKVPVEIQIAQEEMGIAVLNPGRLPVILAGRQRFRFGR
jgi:hypothetical protein